MAYKWPQLAIEGGPKAKKHPYHKGNRYGKAELKEVAEALESGRLSSLNGTKVRQMREDFAALVGAKHCTAVTSGTAAVHVALGAVGIRPGDEVITSPATDFGSLTGILYQNAIPVFADLDPHTYTMHPAAIEAAVTRKTAAIVVVHLGGNPADMDAIRRIARKHRLALIEDCAQAFLARWRGRCVGTLGDVGCFSLNSAKHISTGEGGLVVSNDAAIADRCESFADKFYSREKGRRLAGLYDIPQLAPGYRMTELEGAVAVAQIRKLPAIVKHYERIGDGYGEGLAGIPGIAPHGVLPRARPTWYFYMFRLDGKLMGVSRDEFRKVLWAEGVRAYAGYIPAPVYRWKLLRERSVYPGSKCPFDCKHARKGITYPVGLCPEAERILADGIILEVNRFFTATDVREAVAGVRKVAAHFLAKKGIALGPAN